MMRLRITNTPSLVVTCELPGGYKILGDYLSEVYPIERYQVLKTTIEGIQEIVDGTLISLSDSAKRPGNKGAIEVFVMNGLARLKLKREGSDMLGARYIYDQHLSLQPRAMLEIMNKWYNIIYPMRGVVG